MSKCALTNGNGCTLAVLEAEIDYYQAGRHRTVAHERLPSQAGRRTFRRFNLPIEQPHPSPLAPRLSLKPTATGSLQKGEQSTGQGEATRDHNALARGRDIVYDGRQSQGRKRSPWDAQNSCAAGVRYCD
ncbi:hypothetical protein J6590_050285 [Homalodisca vitripennis]|nr:hypothetical protein J6590_050285 [Homalodisca vitripennis]